MGRSPCCEKMGLKKGPWTPEEDRILINFIRLHGHPNWRALPKQAGLLRCGKSCRLRWTNYLRPDIKRGNFTLQEEETIIKLHQQLGNRWSIIAGKLPGRTDNEIKNVWHTHLKKRLPQNKQSNSTSERTKKRTRKPKSAKSSNVSEVSKIEHVINCEQDESDNIMMMTSQPVSPQTCTSGSEISTVTMSASENNVSMENVVDGGGDCLGDLLQIDNDFWMDLLPCVQDTAISIPDFPVVSELQFDPNFSSDFLLTESNGLEMSPESREDDMDFFWFHLLVRSNDLTELSQVL